MLSSTGKGANAVTTRTRLTAGIAVVVLALAYLMWNGMRHFTEYYLTVSEFVKQEPAMVGVPARVNGQLVAGSVVYRPRQNLLRFDLRQGRDILPVIYRGTRPDVFSQDVHAIVDGRLSPQHVFVARQVLVQCPSHYAPARPVTG